MLNQETRFTREKYQVEQAPESVGISQRKPCDGEKNDCLKGRVNIKSADSSGVASLILALEVSIIELVPLARQKQACCAVKIGEIATLQGGIEAHQNDGCHGGNQEKKDDCLSPWRRLRRECLFSVWIGEQQAAVYRTPAGSATSAG